MNTKNDRSGKTTDAGNRSSFFEWLEGLIHIDPVHVVSDVWDAFDLWRATRRWSPIRMMIPGMILFFSCFATICFGLLSSNGKKLERYVKKAESIAPLDDYAESERKAAKEAAAGNDGALEPTGEESPKAKAERQAKAEEDAKNAAYADLLFRRVLQLEPNNKNARFYVAANLGARGNVDQARGMMQSLAPADTEAFPRAHEWLAMDMLSQLMRGVNVNRQELEHHLKVAADFSGTRPVVLAAYARMLEGEKRFSEAINMMQRAAQRDASFYLQLSEMQARNKQPIQSKDSVKNAIEHFTRSFGRRDEKDEDRIAVAQAHVQAKDFEAAIKVLQEGLALREDRPLLRRALSNVFRLMYRSQIERTESGQIKTNLSLLNSALLADPTNPQVGEEIAILQRLGVTADDKMLEALKQQLATGRTTAVTHLLLGDSYMNKEDLERAEFHWKLALGQDPNLVLAMNNLAIAYSMRTPPKTEEALQLIQKAIDLSNGDSEYLDSKGEIYDRAGRIDEAIIEYEKAIQAGPGRISTREKLVRCYEKKGEVELADKQNDMIAKIREIMAKNGIDPAANRPTVKPLPPPTASQEKKEELMKKPEPADQPLNIDELLKNAPSQKPSANAEPSGVAPPQ